MIGLKTIKKKVNLYWDIFSTWQDFTFLNSYHNWDKYKRRK